MSRSIVPGALVVLLGVALVAWGLLGLGVLRSEEAVPAPAPGDPG
jgi:hypothetical protein